MTPYELHNLMQDVFEKEIMALRKQGQQEYASSDDAFSNFKDEGKELHLDPEVVLWVHAMKHKSGIASHIRGVTSQREDVRGRINDLIVYLFLLRGLIDEKEEERRREDERRKQTKEQAEVVYRECNIQPLTVQPGKAREQEKPKTDKKKPNQARS